MAAQNHIHLDTTLGTSPENAPTRTWKTIDREETPMAFVNVRYTLGGAPRLHVVTSAGNPVIKYNYQYVVKVAATQSETVKQQKDALIALLGKRAYLVDHEHPANGSDHTAYIRDVVMVDIGPFKRDVADLHFYYVTISLRDLE